jgi:hypothetical protein
VRLGVRGDKWVERSKRDRRVDLVYGDREAWGKQAADRAQRLLVHGAGPVNR